MTISGSAGDYTVTFGGTQVTGKDIDQISADKGDPNNGGLTGALNNGKLVGNVSFGASLFDGPAIVVLTPVDAAADVTPTTLIDGASTATVRTATPGDGSTNEIQEVNVRGGGGTFTLTVSQFVAGVATVIGTTDPIPYNAPANVVRDKLQAKLGSFPNAVEGLGASRSAANLRRHGLEADVERCARENDLDVVPRYVRRVGPAAEVTA